MLKDKQWRGRSAAAVLASLLWLAPALADDWIYTVRGGDTLWGLCQQYTKVKNCWLKIGDYNNVKYPRTLAPGTQVRFPVDWLIDPPAPARVTFVRGKVVATDSENISVTLSKGDFISIGTKLEIPESALVLIQFADKSVMTVEGDSIIRFDILSKFEDTGMVDTRVHLQKGSVHTRVPKRTPASRFEVTTPSSVAAVRGTDFRVSGDGDATRNEVFGGKILVSNESDKKNLDTGKGLLARKDAPLPEAVTLLPKPSIVPVENSAVMPFQLEWSDIEGAEGYRIDLADEKNSRAVVHSVETVESKFILEGLKDACYLAKVSAIDVNLFQGMPATTRLCLATQLSRVGQPEMASSIKNTRTIVWPEIEGADRYRLEFARDEGFSQILETQTTELTSIDYLVSSKKPLYVRVVAEDSQKPRESVASEPLLLQARERDEGIFGRILFILVAIVAVL